MLKMQEELAEKGPEWRNGHYRYEFDVGSDAPELVKMLWVATDRKNNVVTSPANDCMGCTDPAQNDERECWVKAARAIKP